MECVINVTPDVLTPECLFEGAAVDRVRTLVAMQHGSVYSAAEHHVRAVMDAWRHSTRPSDIRTLRAGRRATMRSSRALLALAKCATHLRAAARAMQTGHSYGI